jgi:hypothetical protein
MKKNILVLLVLFMIVLSSCQGKSGPSPTPQLTQLTPGNSLLQEPRHTDFYMFDRVSKDQDVQFLKDNGATHIVMVFNLNTYQPYTPAGWANQLKKAEEVGLKVIAWPGDWEKPQVRTNCNYESPFIRSANGNIERVKPLLDFLVQHESVVGIVTFHEAQYTSNCPFSTSEIIGIKNQIDQYTTNLGRRIPIYGYVGNFFSTPTYWTPDVISKSMDVAIQWRACAGRVDAPCKTIPERITSDRNILVSNGLDGKIKTVFLVQSYKADYPPYDHRLSLDEYKELFDQIYDTNSEDGVGFYTWNAWWEDLSKWPEMWSIVSWVRNHAVNMSGTVPEATVNPNQTVTPMSTMNYNTSTPVSTKVAITKTPTPVYTLTQKPTITVTPGFTQTQMPTVTSTPFSKCIVVEDELYYVSFCAKGN